MGSASRDSASVSGAQMLTRRGFPLDTVQLIGRWGSDAIKVYVQESPLHRGDEFHRPDELNKPEQVREMVEHYLETLRTKFWVVNRVTQSGPPTRSLRVLVR